MLIEKDIPLGSRMVAVCDTFDAIIFGPALPKRTTGSRRSGRTSAVLGNPVRPTMCAEILAGMVAQVGNDDLDERLVRFTS